MPSPIGHSLAGVFVYRCGCCSRCENLRPGVAFLVAVGAANLPDIDFVPGLLLGDANRFHHAITHSLGFVLLATALAYALALAFRSSAKTWASLVGFSVVSHLLLDFFTIDTRAPFGIPLFWPLSDRYFLSSRALFLDIHRSASPFQFLPSLFSHHNLAAAGRELLILGALVVLAELACRIRVRRSPD